MHYILVHNVIPSKEFYEYVLKRYSDLTKEKLPQDKPKDEVKEMGWQQFAKILSE